MPVGPRGGHYVVKGGRKVYGKGGASGEGGSSGLSAEQHAMIARRDPAALRDPAIRAHMMKGHEQATGVGEAARKYDVANKVSPNGHSAHPIAPGHGATPQHEGQVHTPQSLSAASHAAHGKELAQHGFGGGGRGAAGAMMFADKKTMNLTHEGRLAEINKVRAKAGQRPWTLAEYHKKSV